MTKNLECIMLVDDNPYDNMYNEKVIKESNLANAVVVKQTGSEAIEYLKGKENPYPNLILLDISMPGMDGWDFLKEYNILENQMQNKAIVLILATSDNPNDKVKAMYLNIAFGFRTKPLTREMLGEIIDHYF